MEASCFVTSNKSLGKTLHLPPATRTRVLISRPPTGCSFRKGAGSSSSPAITCGSLDREEPRLDSDWRAFRARLVIGGQRADCGEQTQKPPAPVALGDKWAHPLHEPERGCLLIATEKLDGVHIFERAVILLLSAGPLGPSGVILNRPSLMSIKETRPVALDAGGTFSDRPLFFGGPLEEGLLFLVNPPTPSDGKSGGVFDEVMSGVYYGTKESVGCAAEMVKRDVVGVGDFRFFDGCCGWEEQQLRDEIAAGYWTVAACSAGVVGMASAADGNLWEDILGLVADLSPPKC